jgi:predicted amidohydrolase
VPTPEEHKRYGIVYTPDDAADEMVAAIPEDKIRSGRILDACCGEGALILAVARRALALGCAPSQIAPRLHGIDILPVQVATTVARLEALLGVPVPRENFTVENILATGERSLFDP